LRLGKNIRRIIILVSINRTKIHYVQVYKRSVLAFQTYYFKATFLDYFWHDSHHRLEMALYEYDYYICYPSVLVFKSIHHQMYLIA